MTAISYYHGSFSYANPKPGDHVRFVKNPKPGQPGVISMPKNNAQINGVVHSIVNGVGYVQVKDSSTISVKGSGSSWAASRAVVMR